MSSADIYAARGFGGRQEAPKRPALVIVDLCYGFTDPASPLHCDSDAAVAGTATLLEAARAGGAPVAFTTIGYDELGLRTAAHYIAKSPALGELTAGSRWSEIDARIAPRADETVIHKLFASAFFGTALSSLLAAERCDGVIITGASTSGCVRATAVDALQHGYRMIVAREAVADRAPVSGETALTDISAKYGEVLSVEESAALLRAAEPRS